MTLQNRIAFVTGANRGIGRALTEALLAAGAAKVYAAARNPGSLPDFGDSRVVPVTLDITDPSQVADAAGFADDVDLLINNAGVLSFGGLADAAADDLRRDMEVNYFGTLDVVRAFLPTLKRSGNADIVNVASIVSFVSFPMLGGYSASKAALYSVTQGLRTELAPLGIRVHSVNPGPIDTDMAADIEMDKTSPEETARNILTGIETGNGDIFPDPAGEQMFGVWRDDYRQLEANVAAMAAENQ